MKEFKTQELNKWRGVFGSQYTRRNTMSLKELNNLYLRNYGITRSRLNRDFLKGIDRSSKILEIGSNIGSQLACLKRMGFKRLYGIEPQESALTYCRKQVAQLNVIKADAFDIPFKDGYFDLVFTSGVLIHINPRDIKRAIKEIYRCSSRYIWGFEYYSKEYETMDYRGENNLLWKADFLRLYTEMFPGLKKVKVKQIKYLHSSNVDTMFLLKKHG